MATIYFEKLELSDTFKEWRDKINHAIDIIKANSTVIDNVTIKRNEPGEMEAHDVIVDSLAGQVKASAYGQIGRAKQITSSTDFNTLVVDGNYTGYASVTVADNNAPDNYTNMVISVRVTTYGDTVIQIMTVGSVLTYTRQSVNGGASWAGWTSIGGTKATVTIYVSKSGSNNNTGYDSAYPVATIDRAIQIAKGAIPRASNGSVKLCIGEGNWDSVTFDSLPFLIQIYPYNNVTPSEYSTSIPVFRNIIFRNTRADIFGIVADYLECGYQSEVYIGNGYKKIGRFYIIRDGFIEFASDNSETNVLDIFDNSINYPVFDVYAGGTVYIAGYLHILLSENINKTFISIGQFGHFYTYNGRCVFDSTEAVNTGKKAVIYHNANFDTNELGSNTLPTFLTSTLPGSGYTIEKGAIINGIPYGTAWDADVLHLSGGTMTGAIKFNVPHTAMYYTDDTTNNYKYLTIRAGDTWDTCSKIQLFTEDSPNSPNEITLTSGGNSLFLFPNGNLTWGGSSFNLPTGTISGIINSTSNASPTLRFYDGTNTGGNLYLLSSQHESYLGGFVLRAFASNNTTYKDLTGKSDGTMTWAGTFSATSIYNAVWNDYAEFFPRGEETEPGDIIALDTNSSKEQYIKASKSSTLIVGAHSNTYAHLIGGEEAPDGEDFVKYNLPKYIPIGLSGRINIKFKGKSKKGHPVTISDTPGVGELYSGTGNIIGYIVEDSNQNAEELRLVKILIRNI